MESFALLALVVIGFLVMLHILSPARSVKWILFVLVLFALGPTILKMIENQYHGFLQSSHPWWVYVLGVLACLVALRIFLDFLLPWRRR